jgi:hypothetical protein
MCSLISYVAGPSEDEGYFPQNKSGYHNIAAKKNAKDTTGVITIIIFLNGQTRWTKSNNIWKHLLPMKKKGQRDNQ